MNINPKDFSSFQLVGSGWSITTFNYGVAIQSFNRTNSPITLYGIKPNGEKTLIDER